LRNALDFGKRCALSAVLMNEDAGATVLHQTESIRHADVSALNQMALSIVQANRFDNHDAFVSQCVVGKKNAVALEHCANRAL
jgi:hypothetical protein